MIKSEDYLRELMIIFFCKKNIIIFTTFCCAIFALMVAIYSSPIYSANGTILIKGKKREKSPEAIEIDTSKVDLIYAVGKEDLASEMSIISSSDVIKKSVLNLSSDVRFPELSIKENIIKMKQEIKEGIDLKILPSSTLIKVTLSYGDSEKAVLILEQIFIEYQRERFRIFNPKTAEDFYRAQTEKFMNRIVLLENKLVELSKRSNTPDPEIEIQNNLIIKKDIEQQVTLLINKKIEKQGHIDSIKKSIKNNYSLYSHISVSSISNMVEKIQNLLIKKVDMMNFYKPESQKINQINKEIEKSYDLIKNEVVNYLRDNEEQLKSIDLQIKNQKENILLIEKRNIDLYSYDIEKKRIEQDLLFNRKSHEIFIQRKEEAKINNASEANNIFSIDIIDMPSSSGKAVFPQKKKLVLMGIAAGFITGCCFGFIFAYFDHTIKTPEDIYTYIELPILFSMVRYRK